MFVDLLILFLAAFTGGISTFALPEVRSRHYKLALVFAGAYLFSITIIHILPELFSHTKQPGTIGLYVLAGFFFQQFLEYFTDGAEHGHVHEHEKGASHSIKGSAMLLIAMLIHSFLEGSLLAHPSTIHPHHDSRSLLAGIVLHKAPAAFALMSILLCSMKKNVALLFLIIFALASPIGLLIGDFYVENSKLSDETFSILFAIVSGSFLHISTTIVYESSVDHHFNARRLGVALAGALVAIMAEVWF
ncbi:zinc permease [Fulvivirga sp. M361]|uniref:ZIP family metal transporter n=1 Tax=Fulvivirga sp. M361 TaxID=2594266 RepID=UPI00117A3DA1|nr:ZIP family metal transporter [Fulvivirga sp. M361]TRX50891.1 zinc permease [Fulvivirga sp. M361]